LIVRLVQAPPRVRWCMNASDALCCDGVVDGVVDERAI
jgi:hypothetical protein